MAEIRTSVAPPKTKIFVGRLPDEAEPNELRKLFERYGIVTECDVLYRYGFVHMKTEEMAARAIQELHNSEFMGVRISVEQSTGKKSGRGFSEGGYGPLRARGGMRGARTTPYIRRVPGDYEKRPGGIQSYGFVRDDYDYYGRSRGHPMYNRILDRSAPDMNRDKYERGSFTRGGFSSSHENSWTSGPGYDRCTDDNGSHFSAGMYRRRTPPPPQRFAGPHFGAANIDSYGPPFRH